MRYPIQGALIENAEYVINHSATKVHKRLCLKTVSRNAREGRVPDMPPEALGQLSGRSVRDNAHVVQLSKKVDRLHCRNLPCMDIFVCKCAVLGGYMVTF